MCGIVGYRGNRSASPVLVECLKRLEYRGYDSYGFATLDKGKITVEKDIGKITQASTKELPGLIGIGHSRWATHGKVSKENAHPHSDCKGKIAVVHNGIVENYPELKDRLVKNGHVFKSETDTEVITHLIEENLNLGFVDAVKQAVSGIKGRYAIVAMNSDSDKIIGVRRGSPLILGVKDEETFIASDVPAFLNYTRNVVYLDDNEMVVIGDKNIFHDLKTGKEVEKRVVEIDWIAKQAEKGDYEHFLLKEIMEQKESIRRAINQDDKDIMKIADMINNAFGTFFIGCGTAGKVCLTGEYIFSKVAKKHINFIPASEFPNYHHFLTDKTLIISVSQSGETADVLESLEVAKKKGTKIVSILNVTGSSIDRLSDHTFLINAGPEKAIASTKATTSQMAVITLLAYACAGKLDGGKRLLIDTASKVNDMLNPRYEDRIRKLAERLKDSPNIYIIGRGLNYPIALESAIKIMELSNIHAQGFAGGEMKHYSLSLVEKGSPCIVLVSNDETKDDTISNAMEIKARGGYVIGVSPENNNVFDYWLKVPDAGNASSIVNLIPIQILSYHLALLRGCDPDYCRNLAKSVTVK